MNQAEFNHTVSEHAKWLQGGSGVRADFTRTWLHEIDATDCDLTGSIWDFASVFCTNFTGSVFTNSAMYKAKFNACNFTNVSFKEAFLFGSLFTNSVFAQTDLWNTIGNGTQIISMQLGGQHVCYTADVLQVNCRQFEISKIWHLSDQEITSKMRNYPVTEVSVLLAWWIAWRDLISDIVQKHPAHPL